MDVMRFILRLLGWLLTLILQIAVSFMFIFLCSYLFSGFGALTRLGWLALLFIIWLGYLIGINLVGWLAIRFAWKSTLPLTRRRLLATAVGGLIPLLILLPIGYSVPVGDEGSSFYNLVTNNWQPVLAQASLFTALLGYYVPGLVKTRQ